MGLDIRLPIGLMFSLLGVLLTGYGAVNRAGSSPKLMGRISTSTSAGASSCSCLAC